MKITIVSRSWPSKERSGVPLIAKQHFDILVNAGYIVSIVGTNIDLKHEYLHDTVAYYVSSKGSGALYSLANVDLISLKNAFEKSKPDLLVIEAWQTALGDASVDLAYKMGIPILLISHGISLHPFTNKFTDYIRSLAWLFYSTYLLPKRISRLNVITTLSEDSTSKRFYDRDLAKKLNVPVVPLVNAPVNWNSNQIQFERRKRQILVIGYFSEIKNQLGSLVVYSKLATTAELIFIGKRTGEYYYKCLKLVDKLGLTNRVSFREDDECDVGTEISKSLVVLSSSLTEALPVALIEAMASGTPFVSTSVGAVPSLNAGIVSNDIFTQRREILSLLENQEYWYLYSEKGRLAYQARYTQAHVRENLISAVSLALKSNDIKQ